MQVYNLEKFLAWVKSSPCQFTVSSMSGGYVHVKFLVPCDKSIPSSSHKHCCGVDDLDEFINRCYEDGFRDGRLDMHHEEHGEHKQYDEPEGVQIPEYYLNELNKPVGIVKEKSK